MQEENPQKWEQEDHVCREGDACWLENLLDDDEMSVEEAGFMQGYNDAEEEDIEFIC